MIPKAIAKPSSLDARPEAGRTIVDVQASQVSYVSQPDAATQIILQAVAATMLAASRTAKSHTHGDVPASVWDPA